MAEQLTPITAPGAQFTALMEQHAEAFSQTAADFDGAGRFVRPNIEAMRDSGALAAAVPQELGGMGVSSLHDLGVAVARLARGDASTAIASWMHLVASHMMASAYRALKAQGRDDAASTLAGSLGGIVREGHIYAVLSTEPGTYASYPQTRATPCDDGWELNGVKIFATGAQAATHLNAAVQFDGPDGSPHFGFALIPAATPGITINDDWDALGMRGSGSGSVKLDAVRIPASTLSQMGPLDVESAAVVHAMAGRNVGLVGTCIGIAEAAREQALLLATTRRKKPRDRVAARRFAIQQLAGEVDVLLNAVRATFAADCLRIERIQASTTPKLARLEAMRELEAGTAATKIFVERSCVQIVDKCLTISGGGGYMASSPISRHYRDVRALSFMFPQATETLQYIGMVALGLDPELDL